MGTNRSHLLPLNYYFAIVPLTHCFQLNLIFDIMMNKRTKIDCVIRHVNDQTIQIVVHVDVDLSKKKKKKTAMHLRNEIQSKICCMWMCEWCYLFLSEMWLKSLALNFNWRFYVVKKKKNDPLKVIHVCHFSNILTLCGKYPTTSNISCWMLRVKTKHLSVENSTNKLIRSKNKQTLMRIVKIFDLNVLQNVWKRSA